MQNIEFSNSYLRSAHEQPSEGDWWIIPSLRLLIEQIEFSLSLSDGCDNIHGSQRVANNVTVLEDRASQSALRNNALKISNMWLRETLLFLRDVNASTHAQQIDSQEIDCQPQNLSRGA